MNHAAGFESSAIRPAEFAERCREACIYRASML
jgi:hypothetical protein